MTTLYQVAAANKGIVVGTGNKVEDFGVGFYTKYGDGGVDISPIADCSKTEVWELGKELGILKEIIDAAPTDGLWDDGRTDEGQLGLKYEELEELWIILIQLIELNTKQLENKTCIKWSQFRYAKFQINQIDSQIYFLSIFLK